MNPWEANLQEYINFEKGCYIGQEVILRLNTYKKVQRRLMALAFSGGCGGFRGRQATQGRAGGGRSDLRGPPAHLRRPNRPGAGQEGTSPTAETRLQAGNATATVRELPSRVPVAG